MLSKKFLDKFTCLPKAEQVYLLDNILYSF